jgi:protein O-GlcNAc transferase
MSEVTIQQAFDLAIQHHQAGRLKEAESIYRQILNVAPRDAESLHQLGLIAHQVGRNDIAVNLIVQATTHNPADSSAFSNLGKIFREMGLLDKAIAACHKAISLRPDNEAAHNNLGIALAENGQIQEGIVAYRQALMLRPDFVEASCNLAAALVGNDQLDEAIALYRQVIAGNPDYPYAHYNLGSILHAKGELHEAEAAYRQAVALKPDYTEAFNNLSNTLRDMGKLQEAIAAHHQSIALQPDDPAYHCNLGNTLAKTGQLEEALKSYRQAITLQPDVCEAHNNLGNAFYAKGSINEAIAAYRQALALKSDYASAHSNLALVMNYQSNLALSTILEEHRRWSLQHAEPLRPLIQRHTNDRSTHRRLRIGYVSPDFRDHSVAYFLEALLEKHDPAQVEIFCYAELVNPDAVSARIEHLVTHWRKIFGLMDDKVADFVRGDAIDILVDLAGHTASNRLPVFARKPAPIQVTWLGYPNTTGMDTIDYRLTDAFADPPGSTEHLDSEQLICLPHTAWCYRPLEDTPQVSISPAHEVDHITFGCFNAMPKINRPLLEMWSRILLAVPGSRLLLKNAALGEHSVAQELRKQLQELGVDLQQVDILGIAPLTSGHLATYGQVDIALDTFPYHGTTTTCEALWMGVPVVTLAGQTHVSRVGVSLLTNIGYPEWIAASPEEYVKIAAELAKDRKQLTQLRADLRSRMQASPIMDAASFARDMESTYRKMWRTWCEQPDFPPSS